MYIYSYKSYTPASGGDSHSAPPGISVRASQMWPGLTGFPHLQIQVLSLSMSGGSRLGEVTGDGRYAMKYMYRYCGIYIYIYMHIFIYTSVCVCDMMCIYIYTCAKGDVTWNIHE